MTSSVYSYLNQIFYNHKKFDDSSNIIDLEKWMLSPSILSKKIDLDVVDSIPLSVSIETQSVEITSTSSEFKPVNSDTLFWCAYAIHHGEAGYWVIGNKYKNTEIAEKQKIIEYIKQDQGQFKRRFHKMSNVGIQEIMAELMIDKKTSWKTFYAMTAYYGFNAIIVYENTYLEFSPILNEPIHTYLFHRTKDGHVSVSLTPLTSDKIMEIKSGKICLDQTPDKPLKSASNYKVDELITMAESIGVDVKQGLYNKWKKQDWYNSLISKCQWL
jgi:hypothetical protein